MPPKEQEHEKLLYGVIARRQGDSKPVVLAEHTAEPGNFASIARRVLERVPEVDGKTSFTVDPNVCHVTIDSGIIHMVMMKKKLGAKKRVPFAFNDDIKKKFKKKFGDMRATVMPKDTYDQFSPQIAERLEHYTLHPDGAIEAAKQQVDDLKKIMIENVDKILERGEKLSLLAAKTDELVAKSETFKSSANALKNKMFWKNLKMLLLMLTPVLITVGVGAAYFLGPVIVAG